MPLWPQVVMVLNMSPTYHYRLEQYRIVWHPLPCLVTLWHSFSGFPVQVEALTVYPPSGVSGGNCSLHSGPVRVIGRGHLQGGSDLGAHCQSICAAPSQHNADRLPQDVQI